MAATIFFVVFVAFAFRNLWHLVISQQASHNTLSTSQGAPEHPPVLAPEEQTKVRSQTGQRLGFCVWASGWVNR